MSFQKRFHLLALKGCVIAALLWVLPEWQPTWAQVQGAPSTEPRQERANGDQEHPAQSASQKPPSSVQQSIEITEEKEALPDKHRPNCGNPNEAAYEDICQQRRMADVAEKTYDLGVSQWWLTLANIIASVLAVLVTGWAAIAATIAARAAVDANAINGDIGRAQARAYLNGKSGSYQRSKGLITGTVVVKNYGQSPARNVRIDLTCQFVPRAGILMPATGLLHRTEIGKGPVIIQAGAEHGFFFTWPWKDETAEDWLDDLGPRPHPMRFDWVIEAHLSWRDVFKTNDDIRFSLSPSDQSLLNHPGKEPPESGELDIRPT